MIEYTKEDLMKLQERAPTNGPLSFILKKSGYDPVKYEELMRKWPKEHTLIFETPLEDLPLNIGDEYKKGIRLWRFEIGK